MKKPPGARSLTMLSGRNTKIQAVLLFSPEGTNYGNRYSKYSVTFTPSDPSTAIVMWDFLFTVEHGAIRFYAIGNNSCGGFDTLINAEISRLGINSIRANLPHYCDEHPIECIFENTTSYEIDLSVTVPAVIVPKDVIHDLMAERTETWE